MPTKTVLILANSTKRSGHCVAGREIINGKHGEGYTIGKWLRPLSDVGREGELNTYETRKTNGHPVQVLDFVKMNLPKRIGTACQPENWSMGEQWEDVSHLYQKPPFYLVEEHPDNIWLDPVRAKSDRASSFFVENKPPQQSLVIIRPKNLVISLSTNDWDKQRKRALFEYNGTQYDLGLTDPVFESQYCRQIPAKGQTERRFRLPCGDKCGLCISLTAVFATDGNHYKVVATVFENI